MRNLILAFVLIFMGSLNGYSQTALDTDGLNNLDNVFLFSLKKYCNSLDSLNTKVVYVRSNYNIGEKWPTKINTFEIKYLNSEKDHKKAIKENGGRVTIVEISSLEMRNGKFSVDVIPFSATYRKRMIHLVNGGGLRVYFDYDEGKKGLIYKSEKWNGI